MNVIAKVVKGQEYLIADMIATKLNKTKSEILIKDNPNLFREEDGYSWRFIPSRDVDWTWIDKIHKYLTPNKLYKNVFIDFDLYTGKSTVYKY